jgi:hypothetical protein
VLLSLSFLPPLSPISFHLLSEELNISLRIITIFKIKIKKKMPDENKTVSE